MNCYHEKSSSCVPEELDLEVSQTFHMIDKFLNRVAYFYSITNAPEMLILLFKI